MDKAQNNVGIVENLKETWKVLNHETAMYAISKTFDWFQMGIQGRKEQGVNKQSLSSQMRKVAMVESAL